MKIYAIIFPIQEYVEHKYNKYVEFIQDYLMRDLLNELKCHFGRILNEIRKNYRVIWYTTKDSKISKIFDVDESDKIIRDSLSTRDLLYSTKYPGYENLINELKSCENLEEIVIGGFHRNDCVIKCCNILSSEFNIAVKVDDRISDIAVEKFIIQKLQEAYNAFMLAKIF